MQSTYYCRILMKIESSRQIFENNYQISWKSVRWEPSRSMRKERRADRQDEANSRFFDNSANEP